MAKTAKIAKTEYWAMGVALSNQKSLWHRAKAQAFGAVLPVLLPQNCLLCSAHSGVAALCMPCSASLPLLDSACCPVCAIPTPGGQTCGHCLSNPPHFDATRARYRYSFPLDKLLQQFKYAQRLAVSPLFKAALLTPATDDTLGLDAPPFDAIIAVPASPAHLRARGFNPAVELARPLAKQLGLPLWLAVCTRPLDAPAQASLPWKERQKNIKGAFHCHADLSGKRILVVDDVMTTGATLNELARTLKRHGAAYVENRVVARAVRE